MSQPLQFVRILALGGWVGAIVYFAAVVARGAFAVLPTRDEAGRVVAFTLTGLHAMGLLLAAIFVLASVLVAKGPKTFVAPTVLGVLLMALLTMASQYRVIPRMERLRNQMGSLDQTPASDPRRAEWDRLHATSVGMEGAVLLIGVLTLFLTLREDGSPG
ncbi:MAG TPA: DUF4149 domain-containing protein [Candidatus Acidoferrales bacterium]|nr:DUF4149 domain-containing protein [Candidatus Acidoferrales bacterium]